MSLVLSHILVAVLQLGLPVAAISWMLFYRLYVTGELPRDADKKAIRKGLKQIRKASKKAATRSSNLLHNKWMKFGGGFYGVAALWTLLVMEGQGVVQTVEHPGSLVGMFDDGIVDFVVQMLTNQITTFVNALVWFGFWAERVGFFTGVLVAYGGYALGLRASRYEFGLATQVLAMDWRVQLRQAFQRPRGPSEPQ